ncbi:MAG: hypothetical protein NT163_02100 [Chlorobiales bacterium]|nr:hypothetical protein [Chlorobiales bacterium]
MFTHFLMLIYPVSAQCRWIADFLALPIDRLATSTAGMNHLAIE